MKKSGVFHIPVVSALGGVMHNVGQLFIAYLTIQTYSIVYYIPILLISGLLTGILIGTVATLLMPYIQKILNRGMQL